MLKVFYPIYPIEKHVDDIIVWLKETKIIPFRHYSYVIYSLVNANLTPTVLESETYKDLINEGFEVKKTLITLKLQMDYTFLFVTVLQKTMSFMSVKNIKQSIK